MPRNEFAFKVWGACSKLRDLDFGFNGAVPMKLKASEIKTICEIYKADVEDFENVLEIEQIAYPFILEDKK